MAFILMCYHSSIGDGEIMASFPPSMKEIKENPAGVRTTVLGRPCHADSDIRGKCCEKNVF